MEKLQELYRQYESLKVRIESGENSENLNLQLRDILSGITGELTKSSRAVLKPEFGGAHGGDKVFNSFGEFLQSVRKAETPGQKIDQRLYQTRAAGLSETVPSDGGF